MRDFKNHFQYCHNIWIINTILIFILLVFPNLMKIWILRIIHISNIVTIVMIIPWISCSTFNNPCYLSASLQYRNWYEDIYKNKIEINLSFSNVRVQKENPAKFVRTSSDSPAPSKLSNTLTSENIRILFNVYFFV